MAKTKEDNSLGNTLLTGAGILGGSWLLYEIFKAIGTKKTYYYCPTCDYEHIEWGNKSCPRCKTGIRWPGENGYKGQNK